MERASIGGRANWAGAEFELRLGVEFCVYILVGQAAGLGPGAARRVQLQAPEVVDDVVLEFETGARWAIQAKGACLSPANPLCQKQPQLATPAALLQVGGNVIVSQHTLAR